MEYKHNDPIKFLESERVYLRPVEAEDVDMLYFCLWDTEIRRLTGTKAVFSKQQVKQFWEAVATDRSRIDLLICLQENQQPIGELSLQEIDYQNRKAIVRIAIFDAEYHGKGYGTEAMRLLLTYGFDVLHLHRIGLDVYSFNARAIQAYKKLGFKQEGVIRDDLFYDGAYHDSILMGVLEDEFRALNPLHVGK
jgi:RimJ/RimL family protein N-acetyltransferase